MTDQPLYDIAFRKLQAAYIERLRLEGTEIGDILGRLAAGTQTPADFPRALHLAHGLAGSGSVFGFAAVTKAGREADLLAATLLADHPDGKDIPPDTLRHFDESFKALQGACTDGVKNAGTGLTATASPIAIDSIASGTSVLLIDDDENLNAFLREKLSARGVHVVTATTGAEAMRILNERVPNLIVLDVQLPGMDGHDILKHLKYDGKFGIIPVVMLSARGDPKDSDDAKRLGAIDYIQKPFDPDQLMETLERLLDAARYHVFIADNDNMLLELLQEKFRLRGFRVSVADDGKVAWNQIFRTLPDLVILDRMMPGMDGLAVLKNIRTESETKLIPAIVLSARKEDRDIQIGMQMGAQDYMVKPCAPEELVERALKLLQKHK